MESFFGTLQLEVLDRQTWKRAPARSPSKTGVVLDRPGREGVPEAVGVGVDAGPLAEPREEGPQKVLVHRSARLLGTFDREEQRPLVLSPEPIEVLAQRGFGPIPGCVLGGPPHPHPPAESLRDSDRLKALAQAVEGLSGWRLELVVTNPREVGGEWGEGNIQFGTLLEGDSNLPLKAFAAGLQRGHPDPPGATSPARSAPDLGAALTAPAPPSVDPYCSEGRMF